MNSRSLAIPTLLAASVAVPYVATTAPDWSKAWTGSLAADGSTSTPSGWQPLGQPGGLPSQSAASASPTLAGLPPRPTPPPIEGVPTYSLAEIVRFDVTKEWVYQRWPRKSTALADLDLYGVRVPLVSGTQLSSLAGSLTYYFDRTGRVQRISFRGRTADTTEVVQLVTQQYGLQQQPSAAPGEQLFEQRRGADLISFLRTRPASVLWATSLHDSFSVDLELQDPVTGRPLAMDKAPIPPAPAPQAAAGPNDGKATAAAKSDGEEDMGWGSWFPRSQASKSQIRQLDAVNLAR